MLVYPNNVPIETKEIEQSLTVELLRIQSIYHQHTALLQHARPSTHAFLVAGSHCVLHVMCLWLSWKRTTAWHLLPRRMRPISFCTININLKFSKQSASEAFISTRAFSLGHLCLSESYFYNNDIIYI